MSDDDMDDSLPELPVTRRVVPLEVRFFGTGALVADGNTILGGVSEPDIDGQLQVSVWREVPDEDGLLNPVIAEPTVADAFQVTIEGTAAGFRELARYLLGVAELDVSADPDFHEHHELTSSDGRTHLHLIVRRAPEPQVT